MVWPSPTVHTVDGEIVHYLEKPLAVGATVTGVLDYDRRFALMQQHSGEHIVSGLIFSHYGLHNVGFHMGRDAVTIDFDGFLTDEQLKTLELEANQAIWADQPVEVLWPDRENPLPAFPTEAKRSSRARCGWCAWARWIFAPAAASMWRTPARSASSNSSPASASTRACALKCSPAPRPMPIWRQFGSRTSPSPGQLSAKPLETAKVVSKLRGDLEEAKQRAAQLEEQLFSLRAQALSGAGDVLLIEDKPLKPDSLRRLADAVQTCCGGRCAVFAPTADGYAYALGQPGGEPQGAGEADESGSFRRGGGKAEFAQAPCGQTAPPSRPSSGRRRHDSGHRPPYLRKSVLHRRANKRRLLPGLRQDGLLCRVEQDHLVLPRLEALPPHSALTRLLLRGSPRLLPLGRRHPHATGRAFPTVPPSPCGIYAPTRPLFALGAGESLWRWYQANRFCGHCGGKMTKGKTERSLVCPACGQVVYPKICPGVIAAGSTTATGCS